MAEFAQRVENTNFTISQGSIFPDESSRYIYNYDRLRYRSDYSHENYFFTFIGDGVNYLGSQYVDSLSFSYLELLNADVPFKTQSDFHSYDGGSAYVKLYRMYGGYEDDENRVVLGLQNISMGVGRLWNPTDIFNPRNTYSLEPDEVFGVFAASYTRHINEVSDITAVISQKEDHSFKYALRYKAFLNFTDLGLSVIKSNETLMIGVELEANLGDTGIEVRSEAAYIENDLKKTAVLTKEERFYQAIIGADYGFQNGLSLTLEARYSSQTFDYEQILLNYDSEILPNLAYSKFYLGSTLSYDFTLFLSGSLLYIESFNTHNSRFIAPSITYTLNDYNSFMIGAMIDQGSDESEFGPFSNTYYFNYKLSF
jgi:hypothetical protein